MRLAHLCRRFAKVQTFFNLVVTSPMSDKTEFHQSFRRIWQDGGAKSERRRILGTFKRLDFISS